MKTSIKANKKLTDWIVAFYCDYGKPGTKILIRASYSQESAQNCWEKFSKVWSKNGYRCWQENKKGKILNDLRQEIPLARTWTCSVCKTKHDRDILASNNIKQIGLGRPKFTPVENYNSDSSEAGNPIPLGVG